MKRRQFIKTGGTVLAGAAVFPHISFANKRQKNVLIIGAGIAGLSAAYKLKKNDFNVLLLESRNRIGGRIFTYNFNDDNLTCELGAEWVGASHFRIIEMCEEFELELLNHQFETYSILNRKFSEPNRWGYSSEWSEKYSRLIENYSQMSEEDKKKLDRLDWWRYLVNNGISENDLEIKELFDSTDFGETIRQVSAYAGIAEYAESSPKNEMDYHINGGNSLLIQKLADKVGIENIKLKHTAAGISQTGNKVKVVCSDGKIFEADKVICTIPTFGIQQIKWDPDLPEVYRQALNELQYSRISKTSVLFSERFWKDESMDIITDTLPHYFFHSTKNQFGKKGILTSYAIGDKAYVMSKLNEQSKIREISMALMPAFGDVEKFAEKVVSYYWGSDQFTQGAYAIYNKNQWTRIKDILSTRFENIFFAGEHLADWQGFMEGSVNSGEEAAEIIINES
jgi:monoamine oxidase